MNTHVEQTPVGTPNDWREEIRKVIAIQIPDLVEQSVAKEEERRFRQLKWVVAFIGLVGLGTIGTLGNLAIDKAVDAKAGNIRETLELTKINSLALKINLSKGFSPDDRDDAVALLSRIAEIPAVKRSTEVRSALGDVLRSFAGAGLSAEIDKLFKEYEDEILANGLSTEILLHHYGQRIVGRSTTPTLEDFPLKAFEKLESVAPGHNLRELALAYRLLYDVSIADKRIDDHVRQLLRDSMDLSESDTARFLQEILIRTRGENWQTESTPEGKRLETITRDFFKDYKNLIADVYHTDVNSITEVSEKGIDEGDAPAFAKKLVADGHKL